MAYFVYRDGQSQPIDLTALRDQASAGQLRPEEPVYVVATQAWVTAAQVPELQDAWPQVAQPPPPPPPPSPRSAQPPPQATATAEAGPPPVTGPHNAPGQGARAHELSSADVERLLRRAWALYRDHWKPLLLTAALLLAPAAFLKSCAVAVITAPVAAVAEVGTARVEGSAKRAQDKALELQRRMEEARNAGDAEAARQAGEEYRQAMTELGHDVAATGVAAVGGFLAVFLGLVASFFAHLVMFGIALPLTRGALTVLVADLEAGQPADPLGAWKLLGKRLVPLAVTVLPAALAIAVGTLMFVVPGMVLSFLLVFMTPVVLVEGKSAMAAWKRSVDLVLADWLRVLILMAVFYGITAVARLLAGLVTSGTGFFGNLLEELLAIALVPLPIIGTVLVYFDLRRRLDGVTLAEVRRELAR